MASRFPVGGGDQGFYGRSIGGAYMENNSGGNNGLYRLQEQQQQQRLAVDQNGQIGYRRPDLLMIGKRSLAEFQSAPQFLPNQQQQQNNLFLRSMKQRTGGFQNHPFSPISPLTISIDRSSQDQSLFSSISSVSSGVPVYRDQNNNQLQHIFKPPENSTKTMSTLHDLEKQLLDDDADGGGGGEIDAVSGIANSEWSQNLQDLISPAGTTPGNIISPSPTSSSSSCSSGKTPPAPTPSCKPSEIISEAAAAIVDGKADEITETLARLSQAVSPTGDPEQRLGFHMLRALRCRVSPAENPPPVSVMYGSDHIASVQSLYQLSPCFKFALVSSNYVILDAIAQDNSEKKRVVHIVDFDIGQGWQHLNLVRALVERFPQGPPLELKITAVETEPERKRLEAVRDGLQKILTEKARLTVRLNWVNCPVEELTRESIGCGAEETLVANFAFRLHKIPDESVSVENKRDELLRRVKAMEPRVVTLAEHELNTNTAPLAGRVSECVGYYLAVMDSLEAGRERARVEEAMWRKMGNVVGCEGRDRVERCEVFGKWRARMGMAGFKIRPLEQGVVDSMQFNFSRSSRSGKPGFTVKGDNGGLCFGWMGRTLAVTSSWH